jgi:hypothetical protein
MIGLPLKIVKELKVLLGFLCVVPSFLSLKLTFYMIKNTLTGVRKIRVMTTRMLWIKLAIKH